MPNPGYTEVGRDQVGNVVLVVTGPTQQIDGRMSKELVTVFGVLSEDMAMKLAEAIKRATYSTEVNFIWSPPCDSVEPEGIRN